MAELRLFTLTVTKPPGDPVAGARVRVLSASGTDVTANLLGASEVYTDETGILSRLFLLSAALPAGTYTIQIIKSGYEVFTLTTGSTFVGAGQFTASLSLSTVAGGSYSLTPPVGDYFSAFYPILASVGVEDSEAAWELVRFHITHMDGRTSVLEAPVSSGLAIADLHSRIRLTPRPNFVPDDKTSLIDPDFSDFLTVTTESLTSDGARAITGGEFSFHAANMAPADDTNTLARYAALAPIEWITLFREPIVFRGFYFDTMLYLTGGEPTGLVGMDAKWVRTRAGDPYGENRAYLWVKVLGGADIVLQFRSALFGGAYTAVTGNLRITGDPDGYTHRFDINSVTDDTLYYKVKLVGEPDSAYREVSYHIPAGASLTTARTTLYSSEAASPDESALNATAYTLHVENLDSKLERVGSILTKALTGSHQAQRIRVDAQPDALVQHARLWVTDAAATTITKILTIHYRG